jgi:2-haloacid dehalogenase
MRPPEALIFDVFGTLVDWRGGIARAVATAFATKGLGVDAEGFADAWRAEYQPAMEGVRTGARGYVPLDELHRENLVRVLSIRGVDAFRPAEITQLARAWERLDPWPDVRPGLKALKSQLIIAPCSNGSIALMTRLARHAGLVWDCVLGADIAHDYKPTPAVYRAACDALRLPPSAVMMVAAHNDDLAAARAVGLRTGFVARPYEYGSGQRSDLAPAAEWDIVVDDLPELAGRLVS